MSLLLFLAFDGSTPPGASVLSPAPRLGELANSSLSLVIDPLTRDLIDTDDGWFLEGTDSRTTVLWQLESTRGAWWGDHTSGSRIRAVQQGEEPATALDLRDAVLAAMQPLVAESIIAELAVALDSDENGRVVLLLNYTDRASGRAVDLAYVPFGG
jgi:phage gp46-like protein